MFFNLLGLVATNAATINVNSINALQSACNNSSAGDIIVLANGTYSNVTLDINNNNISVLAQTPGGVFLNVYGDINIIDYADNIIGLLKGNTLVFPEFTWKLDLQVPQQGSFWRRNALVEKNIKLNENFHYVLDRDIFLRSLIELKSKYINSNLGNFRHQIESKSISQSQKWIEEIPILYFQLIDDYKSKQFSKSTISNINAMVNLYLSIELIKIKKIKKSFLLFLKAILIKPTILFSSGLFKKITRYF